MAVHIPHPVTKAVAEVGDDLVCGVAVLAGVAAVLEEGEIRGGTTEDVIACVARTGPSVVAIDSPRSCAAPGNTHRPEEKAIRDAVCGIRWTPPHRKLEGNPYYEWIVEGLRLYEALERQPARVIECFPTASWTRWHGARNGRRRSDWSREALAARELQALPPRTSQDTRDAIAAALTARDYDEGRCQAFGDIVVPREC